MEHQKLTAVAAKKGPATNSRDGSRYLLSIFTSVVLAVLILGGLELHIRREGGIPSVDHTQERWARVRAEIEADTSTSSVALLGASRMQSNISLSTLSDELGGVRVHQLALSGAAAYVAFEDIAHNSQFRGLVVLSIIPSLMMPGPAREEQAPNVAYYNQHWNKARYIDTWLGDQVSSRLAFGDNYYSSIRLLRNLWRYGYFAGPPDYVTNDLHRETTIRFENVNIPALRQSRIESMSVMMQTLDRVDPSSWRQFLSGEFGDLVSKIEGRGGRVVLVYMPVSDDMLQLETSVLPRETYWDPIEELTGADTIHYLDDPDMVNFDLPDASHLGKKDKVPFSQILAASLLQGDEQRFCCAER